MTHHEEIKTTTGIMRRFGTSREQARDILRQKASFDKSMEEMFRKFAPINKEPPPPPQLPKIESSTFQLRPLTIENNVSGGGMAQPAEAGTPLTCVFFANGVVATCQLSALSTVTELP